MIKNKHVAILDNSVLSALDELNALNYLNLLFAQVYIPEEVEREFFAILQQIKKSHRLEALSRLYELRAWLFKCVVREEGSYQLLRQQLDKGESDAIAQYKAMEQRLEINPQQLIVVLDEKPARKVAQKQGITLTGTLKLLARLHFLGALDYTQSVERLKKAKKRYSPEIIQAAFEEAKKELGVS